MEGGGGGGGDQFIPYYIPKYLVIYIPIYSSRYLLIIIYLSEFQAGQGRGVGHGAWGMGRGAWGVKTNKVQTNLPTIFG